MPARDPLLVLGLGNLLCQDDGVGVAAVAWLHRHFEAAPGVRVLDGGTLGLALLPTLETAEVVLIIDAIRSDGPPGSFVRLEGEDVAHAAEHRLSVHQVGVSDLLGAARWQGSLPARLLLLGLVPQSMELGVERTPAVAAALPALVDQVLAECAALGYPFTPRLSHETSSEFGPLGDNFHRLFGLPGEVR